MSLRWALVVAVGFSCSKQAPVADKGEPTEDPKGSEATAEAKVQKRQASNVTFDGVKLGDSYKPLFATPPYDKPCDDDPVDRAKTERAMVYGAQPCRGNSFAEGTTLILFIENRGANQFDVPIIGVVWLGGTYFDSRSTLGLEVGDSRKEVHDLLGAPKAKFSISEKRSLEAEVFDGDFYAVFDGDSAAGYGLGKLPSKLVEGEHHWEVVDEMYRRYTPRVTSLSPDSKRAGCARLLDKYIQLMKAEPDQKEDAAKLEARREDAIEKCVTKISAADFACADKAKNFTEMRECETK